MFRNLLPGSFGVISGFTLLAFYVSLTTGGGGRVFHITTYFLGYVGESNKINMFSIAKVP